MSEEQNQSTVEKQECELCLETNRIDMQIITLHDHSRSRKLNMHVTSKWFNIDNLIKTSNYVILETKFRFRLWYFSISLSLIVKVAGLGNKQNESKHICIYCLPLQLLVNQKCN